MTDQEEENKELLSLLADKKYKNVIKNMDEEEYKKELKNNDLNYLVENI